MPLFRNAVREDRSISKSNQKLYIQMILLHYSKTREELIFRKLTNQQPLFAAKISHNLSRQIKILHTEMDK